MQNHIAQNKTAVRSGSGGSTLPLVVCVAAFLIAFSLALMYSSGLLISRVDRKSDKEHARQLAVSFAKQMDRELKTDNSEFQSFINRFLEDSAYNEYDKDNTSTVYHYIAADDVNDRYGKIKIRLYKVRHEEDEEKLSGAFPKTEYNETSNFTEYLKKYTDVTFQRYTFTVEIVAEWRNMSYNYSTEYNRSDTYPVRFTHRIGDGEAQTITWDGLSNQWKLGSEAGTVYDAWKAPDAEPICYSYLLHETPVTRAYENAHAEAGANLDTGTGGAS